MIKHQGVWLPDGERHMVEWMTREGEIVDGRGTYQIQKFRKAMLHVRQFRTAVDVGAHCGLWSMQMGKKFRFLHAFEPLIEHRACWKANREADLSDQCPAILHPFALGENDATARIEVTTQHSSGSSHISANGEEVEIRRMDDFNLQEVDFIKLDCEGYELFALKGGEQTVREWMPTIIVEQKPGRASRYGLKDTQAVDWLRGLGYEMVKNMSGDYVMVPG